MIFSKALNPKSWNLNSGALESGARGLDRIPPKTLLLPCPRSTPLSRAASLLSTSSSLRLQPWPTSLSQEVLNTLRKRYSPPGGNVHPRAASLDMDSALNALRSSLYWSSHDARPVHQIITMIKWIRTIRVVNKEGSLCTGAISWF
jgi:hypothetical protein